MTEQKRIRVKFIIPAGDPPERRESLSAAPRVGEYVDVGDGVKRYVAAVVWEPWTEPLAKDLAYDVRVDLEIGTAP